MIQIFQLFETYTEFDKQLQNTQLFFNFLNDMNYKITYGDKKINRYCFIKHLINQPVPRSGLGTKTKFPPSIAPIFIILPSAPDELKDHSNLLYFEKVGRSDNHQLKDQIIAITDKLLEYESFATNQHRKMQSQIM